MKTNLFLSIFFNLVVYRKTDICISRPDILVSYRLEDGVTIDKFATKNKIIFNVKSIFDGIWKPNSMIVFTNLDSNENVFIFQLRENKSVRQNERVQLNYLSDLKTIALKISFIRNEDDESRWSLEFKPDSSGFTFFKLCSIFVRSDKTPFVVIEHEILNKGRFIVRKYTEGDRVKVICKLSKGDINKPLPRFDLSFPDEAHVVDNSDFSNLYVKVKIVTLTKDILNRVIFCNVVNGYSANNSEILSFYLKIPIPIKSEKSKIAIALSALICIFLLIMTFIGAYIMIVKQRRDTTKKLVNHHTDQSKRRATMGNSINTSSVTTSRIGRKSFVFDTSSLVKR